MLKKNISNERQKKIIDYLQINKIASVEDLAKELKVTETTIRRDLIYLDEQGLVKRTHGGVLKADTFLNWNKSPLTARFNLYKDIKHKIAKYVADNFIEDGLSLMIDGGSTTIMCSRMIEKKYKNLVIISNTHEVVTNLGSNTTNKIVLTGGDYIPQTHVQVGHFAEAIINRFRVDTAIVSCSGLLVDEGIFSSNPQEAEIKKLMITNARRAILLCDSSKIGKQAFSLIVPMNDIDIIVTDKGAKDSDIEKLKEYNIQVIVV